MTRKEEIRQYLKERNIPITSLEANSIIEGIEWADEHPNPNGKELLYVAQKTTEMTKKEVVSKACEWLKKQRIDNRDNCGYPVVSTFDTTTVEEFICDFKKAMEL